MNESRPVQPPTTPTRTAAAQPIVFCDPADASCAADMSAFLTACLAPEAAPQAVGSIEALANAAQARAEAVLVLVVAPPVEALARALETEMDSRKAVQDWIARAQSMVDLVRRNRRRIVLIQTRAPEAEVMDQLARLGLPTATSAPVAPELPAPDPLLQLVSGALIARDPVATALAQEIGATTCAGTADLPDIGAALQRRAHLQAEVAARARDLAELQCEHAATLQQLVRVQEAWEAQHRACNELRSEARQLQEHVAELEGEIGRIRASKSYRLMAPARWLRARLGPRRSAP